MHSLMRQLQYRCFWHRFALLPSDFHHNRNKKRTLPNEFSFLESVLSLAIFDWLDGFQTALSCTIMHTAWNYCRTIVGLFPASSSETLDFTAFITIMTSSSGAFPLGIPPNADTHILKADSEMPFFHACPPKSDCKRLFVVNRVVKCHFGFRVGPT